MIIVLIGNWMMVVCAAFYLAWWRITFRPPAPEGTPIGNLCLAMAFLSGIAGIVLSVLGMNRTSGDPSGAGVSKIAIVIGGVIAYVLLLALSSMALHRQVTSELMIIILWTVLELCVLDHWSQYCGMTVRAAVTLAVIVILAAILSLICYMLYYRVSYEQGYLIGSIPLLITGCVMIVINIAAVLTRGITK